MLVRLSLATIKKKGLARLQPGSQIIWSGVFPDFKSAQSSVKSSLRTEYESPQDLRKRVTYEIERIVEYSSTKSFVSIDTARFNLLSTFISNSNEKYQILDIGGSAGLISCALQDQVANVKFDLTIYEYPELVNEINHYLLQANLSLPNLSWTTNIPEFETFDILYFGSSLQYFEDWKKLISKILSSNNVRYLVIADTILNPEIGFVTRQVNIRGRAIPYMVVGIPELTQMLKNLGFERILLNQNFVPNHQFDNFPYPYSQSRNQNIIFKNLNFL